MNKQLRIIQVIQSLGKGGAERYAADLSIALKKLGHRIRLISFSEKNEYPELTKSLDFHICHSKVQTSITKPHLINTIQFEKHIEEFKPDIIHSHLFNTEMTTRYNTHPHITYITTCQNNMPEFSNFQIKNIFKKNTWTRLYEKWWMIKKYRACQNNFIAISKDTLAFYKKSLPHDLTNRVELIYHAIDFTKFNTAFSDRSSSLDEIKMIFVARYAPYKNHIFLIDVLNLLIKKGWKASLVLLGDGPEKINVLKKINYLNLKDFVRVEGNVSHVEEYLKNSNVYVHPATYEPFGLVIIEAMAAGLPAICLDGKGNRDLILDGINGYMMKDENPEAFADIIINLFLNKKKYKEISEGAVNYSRDFDINIHAKKIIKYYATCMQNRHFSNN